MTALPKLQPMRLAWRAEAFDHPDWFFEIKFDGFRALAYVQNGACSLVSRKNHVYRAYRDVCAAIAGDLRVENAVLDGEIVCLDEQGRSRFYDLFYFRSEPYFYAFDLLRLNGEDLRDVPLVERKKRLRRIVPRRASRLLYLDHLERHGRKLFGAACAHDLEGIVAKYKFGKYVFSDRRRSWLKIKNPAYSQAESRHEMFETLRG